MYHKNPNHCAMTFNEELHEILGTHRVIRVFNQFSSRTRINSNKDSLPTICKKFYRGDGLHLNVTGSQLLGALISQSIFKALKDVKNPFSKPQRLPVCKKNKAEANGLGRSVGHSQSKSTLPQMIFRDTYVPPPPIEDNHHFPHLPPREDGTNACSGPEYEEFHRSPFVLKGYNEAVKREVKTSTALPEQQLRIRHTRTICKSHLIIFKNFFLPFRQSKSYKISLLAV